MEELGRLHGEKRISFGLKIATSYVEIRGRIILVIRNWVSKDPKREARAVGGSRKMYHCPSQDEAIGNMGK